MRIFLISISVLTILSSCHKLDENESELVGEWEWDHTEIKHNTCDNSQYWYTTITPESENVSYELHITKNGRVHFYENGKRTLNKRIISSSVSLNTISWGNEPHSFSIHFKKNPGDYNLYGPFSDSTLGTGTFPYKSEDCKQYSNFFTRKN